MTIDTEILQRFFSGNYSRKDYLVIKEYLDDPSKEQELRKAMQLHWMDLGRQTLSDVNIDHLHCREFLDHAASSESWGEPLQLLAECDMQAI